MTMLHGHDLEDLRGRLAVDPAEEEAWQHLSKRMFVPFHGGGIISQFDGYEQLAGTRLGALPEQRTKTSNAST